MSQEQIEKRVETFAALAKMVIEKKRSFLDNIINIDVTAVSVHTPETTSKFKQLLDQGKLRFIKDKVKSSQMKQVVLVFFDNKGMVGINHVPRGTSINADYIVGVLRRFPKALH